MLFFSPMMGTPLMALPKVFKRAIVGGADISDVSDDWKPKKNIRAKQMQDDDEILGFIMATVTNRTLQ